MMFTKNGEQYLVPTFGQAYDVFQRTWTGARAMWVCVDERSGLSKLVEFPDQP